MVCEQLVLPPGSLVCCCGHAAHMISPKNVGYRLAASHFYKKKSELTGFVQPADDLPPVWAIKAARGELPSAWAALFANGVDTTLTGGRVTGIQI